MRDKDSITLGIRDFVLFALLGAVSSYLSVVFDNAWLMIAMLAGLGVMLLSSYWAQREHGPGITTELAALFTFLLGALIMHGKLELAIALAIFALGVLFTKPQIKSFRTRVQMHEMRAVLLFLTITFIVLPVLPNQPLDKLFSFPIHVEFIEVMLSALNPYKIWLIVVLVSLVSFVGYGLIKLLGNRAGIGLTGMVGGLVSSTVTTLSFARRSLESPGANRMFAAAVLLASAIMFPRLLLEIAVVNLELMRNIIVPLVAMGITGFALAGWLFYRSRDASVATETVKFDNPFSLKSAVSFGLVFAAILMFTRLATNYLGNSWLPAVAIVSGLTDADAIAFSLSHLQRSGLVSLDWASINLVLGAISNTFMKLFLVLGLGHRGLFRQLLLSFLIVGAVGIVTTFIYYDLNAALH
jgi:uncharacterized membrane protein (DUF4010 family)